MDLVFGRVFAFEFSRPRVLTHMPEFEFSVSQTSECLAKIRTIRRQLLANEYPSPLGRKLLKAVRILTFIRQVMVSSLGPNGSYSARFSPLEANVGLVPRIKRRPLLSTLSLICKIFRSVWRQKCVMRDFITSTPRQT
jgi:hypothetical protein